MSILSIALPRSPQLPVARCSVCGFREVRTDEVVERGLALAECPRCEHRWTSPVATHPHLARSVVRVGPAVEEPATAA